MLKLLEHVINTAIFCVIHITLFVFWNDFIVLQAFKFASAQQQLLGDPDFNKEKVKNVTQTMLE